MSSALKTRLGSVFTSAVRSIRKFAYHQKDNQPIQKDQGTQPRLGLALGGGFARGVAHVGVLKVLVENKIPIAALAGTSAGSLAAAAFASGCTIEELIAASRNLCWNRIGRWTFSRLGFASNERMDALLRGLLHCQTFEELKIPLAVVAADLLSGQAVTFRSGDLITPVRASCCFPGLFVPVKHAGGLLVDGAIVGSVPVAAVEEMGVDVIAAVYIGGNGHTPQPTNFFQIVSESFEILQNTNRPDWRERSNLVIEPRVDGIRWDDFEHPEEMIAAGEAAARAALPSLRLLMQPRPGAVPQALPAGLRPAPLILKTQSHLGK